MTIFQGIVLAVIQGLTEFLPVSSSGHLVLFQNFLGFSEPPVFFDILLHVGTLGSILVFFWKDIWKLFLDIKKNPLTLVNFFWGTIPAVIVGFLFYSQLRSAFSSLSLVAVAWIFFGVILVLTSTTKSKEKEMTWKDSLFVGLSQALALVPGISRSGMTISAGLFRKLSFETVFRFSFFLAIPAILGAVVMEINTFSLSEIHWLREGISMIVSGVVGYLSLIFLQKILKADKFFYFGYYCIILGAVVLLILAVQ